MYISHEGKVHKSITCTSRNVHVYMTHPMFRSGCYGVTPNVIDIIAMVKPSMSSLFIEHVYIVSLTVISHCHEAIM